MENTAAVKKTFIRNHVDYTGARPKHCTGAGREVQNLAVNGAMAECPVCRQVVKTWEGR